MIKPDAVRAGNIGNILAMINNAGFRIVAMKYTQLTKDSAGAFYAVHKERPFYGELVEFMTSGPIVKNTPPTLARMQCTEPTPMKMQNAKDHSSFRKRKCFSKDF